MEVQIAFISEILLYHMRSCWIMADDNWSAETYSIQFQANESSNKPNCVVSTLSNHDLTLTKWSLSASIHIFDSLIRSLTLSLPPPINQSINQPDYSHIHWRIHLGIYSSIHTRLHSLIHSHNFTHSLAHLIVHAFHHSPTDLLAHSFLQIFTPSRVITQPPFPTPNPHPLPHTHTHSFKYSHIVQLFINSSKTNL